MKIYSIIQELRATRSKLEKESILLREKDNLILKQFFRLALNPFIKFYQKKDFNVTVTASVTNNNLSLAMEYLETVIAGRKITGHEAEAAIIRVLESLVADDAEVIKLILKKDPDCGVQTTLDKVWPGLIPSYPCLLASPWSDKLAAALPWASGVIAQKKSDGLRCNLHIDEEGTVKAFTRAGNELNVHGKFDSLGQFAKGQVIDGELLTVNPETGKFNNRQTSNGICSKAIKNTMSQEEANMLHLVAWDIIPASDFQRGITVNLPYEARLNNLYAVVNEASSPLLLSVVETEFVNSIEEANAFYQRMLSEGEEGAMVKTRSDEWADKRLKTTLKMKSECTADVVVTGWKGGEGKLAGNLGSLIVETADGKCVTNMSGFPLKLRSEIYANLINALVAYEVVESSGSVIYYANPGDCDVTMGSVVEVMYNQKIKARDSEVYKLFLPRFSKTRPDKKTANNLEDLK